jgi:hypothetical protein
MTGGRPFGTFIARRFPAFARFTLSTECPLLSNRLSKSVRRKAAVMDPDEGTTKASDLTAHPGGTA